MVERTFISISQQLQLIDRLQHLIYLSSSLIFISGDEGAGKSTLFEQLTNKLNENIKQVHLHFNEKQADVLIRQKIIMQLYDNALFDAQDSLYVSIAQLQEKQERQQAILISVDNAHHLSPEILEELAYLCIHKASLGSSEINVIFSSSEEDNQQAIDFLNKRYPIQEQGTFIEFKLEPLNINNASRLLMHRFKQVNYTSQLENKDALAKQLSLCAGNPKQIILLAETITGGVIKSPLPNRFKALLPALILMFVLVFGVLIIGSYLYPLFTSSSHSVTEVTIEDARDAAPTHLLVVEKNALDTNNDNLATQWPENSLFKIKDNLLLVGDEPQIKHQLIRKYEKLFLVEINTNKTFIAPIIYDFKKKTLLTSKYFGDSFKPTPKVRVPFLLESQKVALIKQKKELLLVKENKLVVKKAPLKKRVVKKPNKYSKYLFSKKLLLIDSDFYTLQLSAMATEHSVDVFIKSNFPEKNLFLYKTRRNGKALYIAIYGQYSNYDAALKGAQKLPRSLSIMGSWIKTYASVHQDIQLNND